MDTIKKHIPIVVAVLVALCLAFYQYGCEPKVKSLMNDNQLVTRPELNMELEQLAAQAEQRMLELDKQEKIRDIILQNALILAAGQPLNPVGLITALAAVYGVGSAASNVRKKLIVSKET